METGFALSELDTTRPHPARMYDAYLGTGIPSAGNVHEVAAQGAPGARVVCIWLTCCR